MAQCSDYLQFLENKQRERERERATLALHQSQNSNIILREGLYQMLDHGRIPESLPGING